jgi:hypothetical protein
VRDELSFARRYSIRWTFDRQKIREMDPNLSGIVVDVDQCALAAARNRNQ